MEVKATVKIELTKEEFEILDKACSILGAFEMNENETTLSLVQQKYIDSVYGVEHENAISTTIDFIAMLLTEYEKNK